MAQTVVSLAEVIIAQLLIRDSSTLPSYDRNVFDTSRSKVSEGLKCVEYFLICEGEGRELV